MSEIEALRVIQQERDYIEQRRNKGKVFRQVIYRSKKKPPLEEVFDHTTKNTFLSKLGPASSWAMEQLGLDRHRNLHMMLLLYPIGVFTWTQARIIINAWQPKDKFIRRKWVEKGLIEMWRKAKTAPGNNQPTLYRLTNRTNYILAQMHKMLLDELPIPTMKTEKASTRYYNKLIGQLNREDQEKKKKGS